MTLTGQANEGKCNHALYRQQEIPDIPLVFRGWYLVDISDGLEWFQPVVSDRESASRNWGYKWGTVLAMPIVVG